MKMVPSLSKNMSRWKPYLWEFILKKDYSQNMTEIVYFPQRISSHPDLINFIRRLLKQYNKNITITEKFKVTPSSPSPNITNPGMGEPPSIYVAVSQTYSEFFS